MNKERLIAKIVKTEKGNIDLVNLDGNVFQNVPPVAVLRVTQNNKIIQIRQQNDASFYIDPEQLQELQILPAAPVPFDASSTTIYDLLVQLRTDFFFELSGGGGVDTNFANTDLVLDADRAHDGDGNGLEMSNFNDILLEILESFEVQSREATIATQETIIDSQDFIDIITQILRLNIPSADAVGKVLTLNNAVTKEVEFTDISGLGNNIYNANGALTGNREVDIDGNELSFTNFQLFEISSGVNLEIQSQQAAIEIDEDLEVNTQDTTLNSDNLDIITGIFRLNIPSADAVGKVLAVTNATSKEVEFINPPTTGGNAIFQEQDATTTSAGALFVTRHTFNGNLDVGSYEISFFTYMGAGGAFAELRNGLLINGVVEYDRGFSTFFVVEQAYPNTFILDVTTAGVFDIQAQFRRVTAGITVDCNFSNLIIKKIA